MNKYSIGIELLAIGSQKDMSTYLTAAEYAALNEDLIGFTDEQYSSLKELLNDICNRYGIAYDRQHIIGHDEYNPKKSDPGELFDWEKLFPRYRAFYQRYSDDRYLYRNSADACIVWPTGTMHFCQPVPKISPCTDHDRNFGVFGFDQVQQECIVPVIWKRQPLYQPD